MPRKSFLASFTNDDDDESEGRFEEGEVDDDDDDDDEGKRSAAERTSKLEEDDEEVRLELSRLTGRSIPNLPLNAFIFFSIIMLVLVS